MKEEDKTKLVEVFNGIPWETDLVKSLLSNNGIQCTNRNSMTGSIMLPPTAIDVVILVNEKDYEPAMQVIREYEKNKEGD